MNIPNASNVREIAQQQKDLYERVKRSEEEAKHRSSMIRRIEIASSFGKFSISTLLRLSRDNQDAFRSAGYTVTQGQQNNRAVTIISWY
jgi:hypothetical protein